MGDKQEVLFLSIKKEKMSNKNHEFLPLTWTYFSSYIENGKRTIAQKDFRKLLSKTLKKRGPKIDKMINAYLMLGTLKEDGDNYIISEVRDHFVQLTIPTARFCIENLSEFAMKIYCFLLNKQQIHDKYGYIENYFFSKKELLESVGYARSQKNLLKLEESLHILENFGLIEYSKEYTGRPGKQGLYLELFKANQYGKIQVEIANDFIKDNKVIEDPVVAQQVCIPGVDMEQMSLAGQAKTWLEMGAYTLDCMPQKYLEAYQEVYAQ